MITTHFPTFDHLLALLEIGLWVDETSPIHGQCKRTNLDTDGVSAKKEGNTCMLEVLITYIYILPLHIQTYHQSKVHVRNNINRYSNSRDIIQNHQT
jgi:hypothetical protein